MSEEWLCECEGQDDACMNCALHEAANEITALRAQVAALTARGEALPIERDTLGRMVREAWVRWAQTQPAPKPSWLAPYDDLSEADKEADRQIGEAICRWTVIHEARAALTVEP
jgi:hypothetical protein